MTSPIAAPVRRTLVAFFAGVFLLVAVVGPAYAIIPAGFYAGTIIRGIIAGATTRAAIPAAGNAAKALSASGLFGVSAAAYIVMCGQNYVSGNDCSGTPLAKLRPQGLTSTDGETAATTIPASGGNTYAATQSGTVTQYRWQGCGGCNPTFGPWVTGTEAQACMADVGRVETWWYGNNAGRITSASPSGGYCNYNVGPTIYVGSQSAPNYTCPNGGTLSGTTCTVAYSCPSGYTLSGSNCVPNSGLWAPDGVPSYRNNGGVWVADPLDPDTAAPLPSPQVDTTTTPTGQPMKVVTTANADGSISIKTYTEGTLNGQTVTTVNDVRVGSSGVPTAITNIYYGDVTTVYNQSAPTTQAPAPQIELPTDYARDATVQQTNTKLQTIITDGVKVKEEGMPTAPDFQAQKDALNNAATERTTGLTTVTDPAGKNTAWGFNLSLPSTCESLSFSGFPLTVDICPYRPIAWDIMSLLWSASTLFLCLGMVGRAVRES